MTPKAKETRNGIDVNRSTLLHVPFLLVFLAGALVATTIMSLILSPRVETLTTAAKVDTGDGSEPVDGTDILASYVVEGQEIERGQFPYIIRRISVDKSITEKELRQLLMHQINEIRQIDYGPMPEHRCAFTVHAYCETANARNMSGLPLATISLLREEDHPTISIAEDTLTAIKEPSQLKFGFAEDIRKSVYWELIRANYECSKQADHEFPDPVASFTKADYDNWLSKRGARFDEIWEQRQDEVASEYKLNRQQVLEVLSEGMRKHWPQPNYSLSE